MRPLALHLTHRGYTPYRKPHYLQRDLTGLGELEVGKALRPDDQIDHNQQAFETVPAETVPAETVPVEPVAAQDKICLLYTSPSPRD